MKVFYLLFIPLLIFSQTPDFTDSLKTNSDSEENKFSFGVLFVPYYSGENFYYNFDISSSRISFTIISAFESRMESQFSYSISKNFLIIGDFGFYSNYALTNINEYNNSYNLISDRTEDMQIISFNFGIKHYLYNNLLDNVKPYIIGGAGKQFAFVNNKERYIPYPGYISNYKDNSNEFLEEINSPYFLNLGFGTEYFFNKSIALNASIRFYYSTSSSIFEYESTYDTYYTHRTEKVENSEILKRVGLGVNFYF
jgi:hypothetical protein